MHTTDESIFAAALSKAPGAERRAFLDGACGGDDDLRRRIERLLEADDRTAGILEHSPDGLTGRYEPHGEQTGDRVGPYKLLQQIGEGGMGVVYMAEQTEPVRRRVALKIIKPGMDSRQVIARFEAERQALAMMDHQNIARVLDAGTTESGRPYFVMELVHGVPITQFCDENHLTPRQRLELFVPVCQAIQHAHQKGIIHRDVKPSNVLVTMYDDKPVPKVIDFGVAKAVESSGGVLTEKTMFTQFGAFVGTFEYMSPEQAQMNAFGVDTRSDIYSLGVLLYELLTGTTPLARERLRQAAIDELVRMIKEEEAPRPSLRLSSSNNLPKIAAARSTDPGRLSGIVRGELDWIVMKCLEKDRTRRYESASGLARDIQRFLADEPVEACPPSTRYRLRKLARKHRTPLRVASLFLVLLILAAITSTWQAIRATLAETRAGKERDLAQRKEVEAVRAREETSKAYSQLTVANRNLERTTSDLRLALYVSDVNRAYKFWEEGNIQRVEELLERHRGGETKDDLRGVEWYYLRRLATRFQAGQIAYLQEPVLGLALSPDGRSLAGAGRGGLTVWDAATGSVRLHRADAPAAHVAFTADGATLITARGYQTPEKGSRAGTVLVRAWDSATGAEIAERSLTFPGGEVGLHALTEDGNALLIFTPDAKLRVWDLAKGREIATLDAQAEDPSIERAMMHLTELTPDRKTLVWQMGPTTMVWDLQTKKIRFKHFQAHPWCFAVAFSPDGKRLACHRGGPPHIVQLWDCDAGKLVAELRGFPGHVYEMAFSSDSKLLATGDEFGTIRLMEAATGKEVAALKGHGGTINSLVFARDGGWLFSAGDDGFVRRWRPIADPGPDRIDGDVDLLPSTGGVCPDGRSFFVYSGAKRGYARWEVIHRDLASNRELNRFEASGRAILSADGRRVAFQNVDERRIKIWDVFAKRELASVESPGLLLGRFCFSPDGRVFALSDRDRIKFCDCETGKDVGLLAVAKASAIGFSPDGRFFAGSGIRTGDADPSVTLWKTDPLTEMAKLPGTARALAFSPDSQILAAVYSDKVVLLETNSHVVRATLKPPQPDAGYPLSRRPPNRFSPDGKLFAIADNMHVQLWDTSTGELLGLLAGPRESTRDLAWSPDGKTLASAIGSKVKLWNVATRQELTTLVGSNGTYWHAFAPDGSLMVADGVNAIRLWRTGLDQIGR